MKYEYTYTVNIERDRDGGGYLATVPALPSCVACGETFEETVAMAKEAIESYIQVLRDRRWPIPREVQPISPISVAVRIEAAA